MRSALFSSLACLVAASVSAVALAGCGFPASAARTPSASIESSSVQLFLAGDGELWVVDVGAARVRHLRLPELRPGDPPYRIVRRSNRIVLWGYATYVLDPRLGARPRLLARGSWFFIPGSREDSLWLAFLDPKSPDTVRALRAVREVTATGRVIVPDRRPPGGRWPVAAVDAGLLFSSRQGQVLLWDSARGAGVRRLPIENPGPTFGNLVAWCRKTCASLRLTDAPSGQERAVAAPAGFAFDATAGAFSPDGLLLAVPVRALGSGLDPEHRLALVDVERGTVALIRGSRVAPGYTFVAWSAAGHDVFITGGERFGKRMIVAYRLGADRASAMPVDVGDFYGVAAL